MKNSSSPISHFASTVLGKPLYPYQAEVANAILTSVLFGQGRIFTVMMARQSGKNQLSALQAFTALATSTLVHLVRFYVDEGYF